MILKTGENNQENFKELKESDELVINVTRAAGIIEVSFLQGNTNNISETPNEPKLSNDGSMKAVYWENGEEIT